MLLFLRSGWVVDLEYACLDVGCKLALIDALLHTNLRGGAKTSKPVK